MRSITSRIMSLVSAVLFASACATDIGAHSPWVSVHDLKTNPSMYVGMTVTLRGQFDGCVSVCGICPQDMTSENFDPFRCIGVSFAALTSTPQDRVVDMLLRSAYRFSEVTVAGKFNAICLTDEKGKVVGDVVCTDGPPNLTDLLVLQVHARKAPASSVYGGLPGEVVPATDNDRTSMLKEFAEVDPVQTFKTEMFSIHYRDTGDLDAQRDREHSTPDGLACVCLDNNCEGRWPKLLLLGPGDPYHCWFMRKTTNGWRVVPNDFWWGLTP